MDALLKFNLDEPEDRLAHTRAVKSTDAYLALWDIANDVFRPARKHGYPNQDLQNKVLEHNEHAVEVIANLEEMFYEILRQYGIDLNDLS